MARCRTRLPSLLRDLSERGTMALNRLGRDRFMSKVVERSPLQRGRDAIARNAWQDAYYLLKEADGEETLRADDLAALAEAAWWTGRLDDCIDARERAYASYLEEGSPASAAMIALVLSHDYSGKLAHSISKGWFARAERLLEKEEEAPAHGYLAWMRTHAFMAVGDLDAALEEADRVLDLGTRFGDR